jgi:threonine dehydrogenase-like Zn-dependent dehydrogenase
MMIYQDRLGTNIGKAQQKCRFLPDVVLEGASTWAAIQTSMDLCANNGAVVVVARHYDAPEFNPVGQGYFGKRLQLLTVYGHPTPGSRWDMRTSYAHTLDLLSRGA